MHWFYRVFARTCWTSMCFIMFSLPCKKKTMILLCFRSTTLQKQWFYLVFAGQCWTTAGVIVLSIEIVNKNIVLQCFRSICFTVFSLKHAKNIVLLCVHSQILKKWWFYFAFFQTRWKAFVLRWFRSNYSVFAHKCWKITGLLCFRSQLLKKHWFYCKTSPRQPSNQATMLRPRIGGLTSTHSFLDREWGTFTDKLFREKPTPGHRATDTGQRIRGLKLR